MDRVSHTSLNKFVSYVIGPYQKNKNVHYSEFILDLIEFLFCLIDFCFRFVRVFFYVKRKNISFSVVAVTFPEIKTMAMSDTGVLLTSTIPSAALRSKRSGFAPCLALKLTL